MPHDIEQILTRLQPGKFDATRAKRFDIERAKGRLESSFPIQRFLNFDREARTAEFVFATDQPIEHWFGQLILDVQPGSVMLDRVQNGICPFLVNHDINQHAGVVIKDTVELGSEIRGKVKFSRSRLGEDMLNDVEDGVRNGTSIGFLIHDMILERDEEGEIPVYRAKKWEMLENSLASIPADIGAHRQFEKVSDAPTRANSTNTENTMTPEEIAAQEAAAATRNAAAPAPVVERSAAELATDEITRWGRSLECPDLAKRFLTESFAENKDITVDAFKRFVKENQAATSQVPTPEPRSYSPGRVEERRQILSIGEEFIRSAEYKATVKKSRMPGTRIATESPILPSVLHRATFDSASTGLATYIDYQHGPILIPNERLTVRDLLTASQTNLAAIPYIQETSYTNGATTVAEEGQKPEATLALQDEFAYVKKIAVMKRVTDEMWNDFPTLRGFIDGRLRFMVQEREEAQLLSGSGTGSEITGILTASIQSQAKGADTVVDAIHKAITKVRINNRTEPDAIVINPLDWEPVRLSKDDNLNYYGGGPFGQLQEDRLWGKRVVVTSNCPENTALVGSFKIGAQIFDREGITVEATNSHDDDFEYNRMAIRVEERLALAIWQLNAFCKVTGI